MSSKAVSSSAKPHTFEVLDQIVALKTLIVIHRALREVDQTFHEEVINYSRSWSHMLNMSHFKDDSSPNAWVRSYVFLEERLECFRVLKYDVEIDPPRTNDLDTPDLLEHLPALQLFSALPTRIGSFQSTLSTSDFSSIWFISLTSSFANNIDILMKQLEQFKAQEKLMKKKKEKRKGNIESHEDAPNWTY
ncbi:unnamed protein product [Microthlaspi erraticum]|uniref:ENTH domain-containing protein n=1 Tax=Microthlaspi erraticum TaxID=1685480 RepID=A0A6D2IJL1_9BRAS|nr:unnamed protein product [Microthlaspi erraticum]